jgi:glycosyltransferase involved in cell wall biosynthesis
VRDLRKDFVARLDILIVVHEAVGNKLKSQMTSDVPIVLWTQHDKDINTIAALDDPVERSSWARFVFVSSWQLEGYRKRFGLPTEKTIILRNAMSPAFATLPPRVPRPRGVPPVFAYTSVPRRGLDVLLDSWPLIRGRLPQARLQVFSSMAPYQKGGALDNYTALYERCRALPGVEYIGSLPQPGLAEALLRVDALTYPSTFAETSCISAIEALAAGCLFLSTDWGALRETTAGLGRLINPPCTREALSREFAAMVVEAWREAQADPEAHDTRITAQQDIMRRTAVWPVRAIEWVAFLEQVIAHHA